jgi:hypothetical protein
MSFKKTQNSEPNPPPLRLRRDLAVPVGREFRRSTAKAGTQNDRGVFRLRRSSAKALAAAEGYDGQVARDHAIDSETTRL